MNAMNLARLCNRNVATVRQSDELTTAAELMRERHIGYLVVVEPQVTDGGFKPIGVLTDRDIVVTVVARGTDPRTLRVGDVMTRPAVIATESDSLKTALESMRRIGVRRLPVVGDRGQLVGVLSLDDIIDSLAAELTDVAGSIRTEQRVEAALRP
jgi:CBS domain-containing protein